MFKLIFEKIKDLSMVAFVVSLAYHTAQSSDSTLLDELCASGVPIAEARELVKSMQTVNNFLAVLEENPDVDSELKKLSQSIGEADPSVREDPAFRAHVHARLESLDGKLQARQRVVGGNTRDVYHAISERDIRRREHLEEEPFREHTRHNPLCCAIL